MGGDGIDEPMAEKTMCDVLGIGSEPSDDDVEEDNEGPPILDIEEDSGGVENASRPWGLLFISEEGARVLATIKSGMKPKGSMCRNAGRCCMDKAKI
jgi:hypothetical protein